MVEKLTGTRPRFTWVFVEDKFPHAVQPLEADEDTLRVGRMKYERAIHLYQVSMESGNWPTRRSTKVPRGGLPRWAIDEYLSE